MTTFWGATPDEIEEAAQKIGDNAKLSAADAGPAYSAANQPDGSYYQLTNSGGLGDVTDLSLQPVSLQAGILSGLPLDQQVFSVSAPAPIAVTGPAGPPLGASINSAAGANQPDGSYYQPFDSGGVAAGLTGGVVGSPLGPAASAPGSGSPSAGTDDRPLLQQFSSRPTNIAGGGTDQSGTLQGYAQNPTVSAAMDKAWAQSHPGGFTDQRQEINLFGRQNARGDVWVEPAQSSFTDAGHSVPENPPGSSWIGHWVDGLLGNRTIFIVHTHPNPGDYDATKASPDDIVYARKWGQPLIVQGTDGLHFYDPAQHPK